MKITRVALSRENQKLVAEGNPTHSMSKTQTRLVTTLFGPDHRYRVELTKEEICKLYEFMTKERKNWWE